MSKDIEDRQMFGDRLLSRSSTTTHAINVTLDITAKVIHIRKQRLRSGLTVPVSKEAAITPRRMAHAPTIGARIIPAHAFGRIRMVTKRISMPRPTAYRSPPRLARGRETHPLLTAFNEYVRVPRLAVVCQAPWTLRLAPALAVPRSALARCHHCLTYSAMKSGITPDIAAPPQ